jgi:hypothetical protein
MINSDLDLELFFVLITKAALLISLKLKNLLTVSQKLCIYFFPTINKKFIRCISIAKILFFFEIRNQAIVIRIGIVSIRKSETRRGRELTKIISYFTIKRKALLHFVSLTIILLAVIIYFRRKNL